MPVIDDPFRVVLRLASERVFACSIDLSALLDVDAAAVMYRLSHSLASFAPLRAFASADQARLNHQHLLTAARAYVVARRKKTVEAIEQGELPLLLVDADG